ncbi:unnamed protein product [Laminaria digitata]
MLGSYSKIMLRALRKQKGYAFINIIGLAAGLTCFILIIFFVKQELSYDNFHTNSERIYRVINQQKGNVYLGTDSFTTTPVPMADVLLEEMPEVVNSTNIDHWNNDEALLGIGEEFFLENGFYAAGNFFDFFDFPLISGSPETVLAEPNSIVLTHSLARKIFGDQDPMGKEVQFNNTALFLVTGIAQDVPGNSSLSFSYVASNVSRSFYRDALENNVWNNNSVQTFILLADNVDIASFSQKIQSLSKKFDHRYSANPEELCKYLLQPLEKIYLHSTFNKDFRGLGKAANVYLFFAIAIVILLLACVNYVNLALARSLKRAREVGMRKTIGANRTQLLGQFLGESVSMSFLALFIALGLAYLVSPLFSQFLEQPFHINLLENWTLIPALIGLVLLVGIISGIYPAFYMSSLKPIEIIKGKLGKKKTRLQHTLIIGQFTASMVLLTSGIIIYQQLDFIQQKDAGYDKQHVITVPVSDNAVIRNPDIIRKIWIQAPQVKNVSLIQYLPTKISSSGGIEAWEGSESGNAIRNMYTNRVDYDFLDVFGITLIAGRPFSREVTSDATASIIINETAAKAFGWTPAEALHKYVEYNRVRRTVIGVVKDFHLHSMHLEIEPMLLNLLPFDEGFLTAKISPVDLPATLALLREGLREISPYPFEYQFLDDRFDQLYKQDRRFGETIGFFTLLAFLIASLGSFGLAAYSAEQRTKEIGVRKVLGASAESIVLMLSKDFSRLVIISIFIATPIVYLCMQEWLNGFAYHIQISLSIFFLTGFITLGIVILSVCYQTVKAARSNPVESLLSA